MNFLSNSTVPEAVSIIILLLDILELVLYHSFAERCVRLFEHFGQLVIRSTNIQIITVYTISGLDQH